MKKINLLIIVIEMLILLIISGILIYECVTIKNTNKDIQSIFEVNKCIQSSEDKLIFITPKDNAKKYFTDFMEENGWDYLMEEQLGSGYCFEKNSKKYYFILQYKSNYALWTDSSISF